MGHYFGNGYWFGPSTDPKPTTAGVNHQFWETDTGRIFVRSGGNWIIKDGVYSGTSAQTKPTGQPVGTRFFETDTGDFLTYDGLYWWLTGAPSMLSQRKWGQSPAGGEATTGSGVMPVLTAATGTGTIADIISDETNGRYRSFPSLTTTLDKGGQRLSNANFTARHFNPMVRFRFQIPSSADFTLSRLYIGLGVNSELTGDDPLNAANGVYVGFISGATHFKVIRNDGSGATDVTGDVAGTAQVLDSNVHTVSIVADNANSRFSIKWDGNAYVHFTTEIPGATVNLTPCWLIETNESGVAKTFRLWYYKFQSEK